MYRVVSAVGDHAPLKKSPFPSADTHRSCFPLTSSNATSLPSAAIQYPYPSPLRVSLPSGPRAVVPPVVRP